MAEFINYKLLCEMIESLNAINKTSTDHVSNIRKLIKQINKTKSDLLEGNIELTDEDMITLQDAVDSAVAGNDISFNINVETTSSIKTFQLSGSTDDVNLVFDPSSIEPPEHGTIVQKLWKVKFKDNTTGHVIFSDTSDEDLSHIFTAQLSTSLSTAPNGAVEDLDVTILLDDLKDIKSRDISSLFTNLEKPGLVCRQLRDIDINTDPELQLLTTEQKNNLINAVNVLNSASSDEIEDAQNELQIKAEEAGLYSTSLGPTANLNYSDLKRFKLRKDQDTIVDIVASMPVVSWGSSIKGIPLRNESGPKNKTNRKDDGTSYIVDLGGIDPVIRQGRPNPLPATRYFNNGPLGATATEGALDRYMGGKCLGINTTNEQVSFQTVYRESDGEIKITLEAKTGLWQLDRSTFDHGNKHAYYTVFSASRAPPAGYMGVVFAPKQNRLGRGRGEIASSITLANGISKTGKTFNIQGSDGPLLDEEKKEIPSGLKGLTCDFDGHALDPIDLLKFLQDNSFNKGSQYLTIPANATLETVEDVLIPAGEFVPQITQAIATLMQFANGKYIRDGGPARFQSGLIPFLPGTPAYTPEWHINWIFYNCGDIECEDNTYHIQDVALDGKAESWIRPSHNVSFMPPGPSPSNSQESRYSPAFPDTFDPVQLRCGIKGTKCLDYIKKINGSKNGEISLSMLPSLENENKIFFTEAPPGAMRGWVKFLVVNCPLPVIATVIVENEQVVQSIPTVNTSDCVTCTCDRLDTTISVNGALNPIWLDEDKKGNDTVIGERKLNFKVGDNVIIRATTGTMHGVSLRLDNMTSNVTIDNEKTLEIMQNEVLTEIKEKLEINNEEDLENNVTALTDDLIDFHGGIPITFTQKATINPINFPDGVVIADFTIGEGAEGSSGSVGCTVHGSSMSFKFEVCD